MENFTPLSGLIGGILIGPAATILLLANGRISGIVGGLLDFRNLNVFWRAAFVAGLLIGAGAYAMTTGWAIPVDIQTSMPVLVVAGLLVGFGTRLGSRCTSGHGLCGVARFSKRSIAATLVFMDVAVFTVFVTGHVV